MDTLLGKSEQPTVVDVTQGYVFSPELNRTGRRNNFFKTSSEDDSDYQSTTQIPIQPSIMHRIHRTAKQGGDEGTTLLGMLRATGSVMGQMKAPAEERNAYYHSVIGVNAAHGRNWDEKLSSYLYTHPTASQTVPTRGRPRTVDQFDDYLRRPPVTSKKRRLKSSHAAGPGLTMSALKKPPVSSRRGRSAGPAHHSVIGSRYDYHPRSSRSAPPRRRAPVVENALRAVAPVDAIAHHQFRLLRMCLRAWRAHAVWAAEAREGALDRWTMAIEFWERRLMLKAIRHWQKLKVLPQLQLRAAEEHHRRVLLSLGLVSFAVNFQRKRWENERIFLAASCWAGHVQGRCFRAWRRFAADRMSHVLMGLPVRSTGMMAAVLHWVHISLGVHVRAVFPQQLLMTSTEAREARWHHESLVRRKQDDEWKRGEVLGETLSVFVRQSHDGFEGDSHLGAIVALCPTERRRRVLAESLAAVNRRWLRFLLYVWRMSARRVTIMRIKCIRRQLRDRLRHWKAMASLCKAENTKIATISGSMDKKLMLDVLGKWRGAHIDRERLMRAEALTEESVRSIVIKAMLVKWRNALIRRDMYHVARQHSNYHNAKKCFAQWHKHAVCKQEQSIRDAQCTSAVLSLKAQRVLFLWIDALKLQRKKKMAMMKWRNSTAVKCLCRWVAYVDHRRAIYDAQAKADGLYSIHCMRHGLNAWRDSVSYAKRIEGVVKTSLLARFGRVQNAVFVAWHETAKARAAKRRQVAKKLKCFALHKAFRSWHVVTTGRLDERERAEKLCEIVKEIRMRHVIEVWAKRLYYVHCIRRVHAAMTLREVRASFTSWRVYVEEKKRLDGVLKRVIARLQNRHVSQCFNSWVSFVRHNQHVREATAEILDHGQVYLQRRVLRAWIEEHRDNLRKQELLRSHATRMLNLKLYHSFSTWTQWVEMRKSEREQITRAVKLWSNQALVSAFNQWREWTLTQIDERENMSTALSFWSNRTIRPAFDRWCDFVLETKTNRENIARAASFWQNRSVAMAFRQWNDWAIESRIQRTNLQRAVALWTNAKLSQGLNSWIDFVHEQKHERETTKKAIGWWTNGVLSRVLSEWQVYAKVRRETRDKQRRAMKFWTNSALVSAFRQWHDYTIESVEERRAIKRAVSLWTNGALSRCFRTWNSNVLSIVSERNAVKKAVAMWTNQKLAQVFVRWQQFTYLEVKERELVQTLEFNRMSRAFIAWHEDSGEAKMQRKAMGYWFNGMLGRAFRHWRSAVEEKKRMENILDRVARRWQNLHLASAFGVIEQYWRLQTYKRELRETAAKHYQLTVWQNGMNRWIHMLRLRFIMKRMLMSQAAAAFRSWWEWTVQHSAKSRRRAEIMEKIYTRQRVRLLEGAFAMLRDHAQEMGRVRQACQIMLQSKLARAFRTWQIFTDVRIGLKETGMEVKRYRDTRIVVKHLNVWREWTHRRFVMQTFLIRMMNMQMARAFLSWRSYTDRRLAAAAAFEEYTEQAERRLAIRVMSSWIQAADLRGRLRHITAIWHGRDLKTTFEAWHRFTVNQRRKLAKDRQNQMLVADAKLVRYLDRWREALRRKQIFNHAVMLFAGRSLENCFHMWLRFTQKQQEKMAIAQAHAGEATARLDNVLLRKCWAAWLDFHSDAQVEKRAIRKAMELWNGNQQGQMFRRWMRFVTIQKENRDRIKQAAAHWHSTALGRAFATWLEYVEEGRDGREKMDKAVAMWENRVVGAAFRQWQDNAAELARQRAVLQRAVGRMLNLRMAGAFERWSLYVVQRKEKKEAVNDAVQHWGNAVVARGFRTWYGNVQLIVQERELLERVAARWRNKHVAACFSKWVGYVDERAFKLNLCGQADELNRILVLRRFWASWERMRRLRVVARRIIMSRATAAMNSWLLYAVHRREKRERREAILVQAAELSARRLLRRCMDQWRDHIEDIQKMRQILMVMEQGKVARCLHSWVTFVQYRQFYRETGAELEERTWRRRAKNALTTWREETHKRIVMSHFIVRMTNRHMASAFDSWRMVASRRVATWIAAEELETIVNQRVMQKSFDTWRNAADLRVRLHTVTAIWRGRDLQTTFQSWRRYAIDQRRKIAKDLQNQSMIAEGKMLRYLAQWREATEKKQRLRSAIMRFSIKSVNLVFQAWHNLTIANRKDWNAIAQFEEMVTERQMRRAFNGWRGIVEEEQQHRVAMAKAVKMMLNRQLGGAFNRWTEFVQERKHEREVMAHAVKMMVNRRIAAALNRWTAYVDHRARKRDMVEQAEFQRVAFIWKTGLHRWCNMYRLRIVTRRLLYNRAYAALRSWHEYASTRSEKAQRRSEIVGQVMERYRNRRLIAGFSALRENALEAQGLRRAIGKLFHGQKSRAFNAWVAFTSHHRYLRECYEELARRHEDLILIKNLETWRAAANRLQVLRVFVTRMSNRSLHQSLMTWHHITSRRMMVYEAYEEYTEQAERRLAIRSMSKWCEAASLRGRLRHITAIWHGRDLKTTFEAWHRFTVNQRRKLAKDRQNQMLVADAKLVRYLDRWRHALQIKKKLHWVVMRFHSKTLEMVVKEWRALTVASAKRREIAAEAFGIKTDTLKRKYFERWREFSNEETKQKELLRRVVGRLQQRKLAAAFATWQENAAWLAQIRRAVEMFTGKGERRMLRDSFTQWTGFVDEQRSLRERYARAVSLHGDRILAICFQSWREWIAKKMRLRLILASHVEHKSDVVLKINFKAWHNYIGRRVLLRERIEEHSSRAPYLRVLRKWQRLLHEKVHQRELLNRVARMWQNRNLASAFRSWLYFTQYRLSLQVAAEQIDEIRCYRIGRKAVAIWREATEERSRLGWAYDQLEATVNNRLIYRTLVTWRDRAEFSRKCSTVVEILWGKRKRALHEQVFTAWKLFVQRKREKEAAIAKGLRFWTNATIRAAWTRWEEYMEEQAHRKSVLSKAIGAMKHAELAWAFQQWRSIVSDAKMKQSAALEFFAHTEQGSKTRMFKRWRAWVQEQQHRREVLAKAMAAMRLRHMRAAFTSWHVFADGRMAEYWAFDEMQNRIRARLLHKYINSWHTDLKRLNAAMVLLADKEEVRMKNIIKKWRGIARRNIKDREAGIELTIGTSRRSALAALATWRAETDKRVKLRRAMAKWQHALLSQAMDAWGAFLQGKREERADDFRTRQLLSHSLERWCNLGRIQEKFRMDNELALQRSSFSLARRYLVYWHNKAMTMQNVRYLFGHNQAMELRLRFERWRYYSQYHIALYRRAEYIAVHAARNAMRQRLRAWRLTMLVTKHFRMSSLRRCFHGWHAHVEGVKTYRDAVLRHRHILLRVENHIRRKEFSVVGRCFAHWKSATVVPRDIVGKALAFRRQHVFSSIFTEWRGAAWTMAAEKRRINVVAAAVRKRELKEVFDVWRHDAARKYDVACIVQSYHDQVKVQLLRRVWTQWHMWHVKQRAAYNMQIRTVIPFLSEWRHALAIKRAAKAAAASHIRYTITGVYWVWRSQYLEAVAIDYHNDHIIETCLGVWRAKARVIRNNRVAEEYNRYRQLRFVFNALRDARREFYAAIHYNRRNLHRVLHEWRTWSHRNAGIHHVCAMINNASTFNLMVAMMREWHGFTAYARRRRSAVFQLLQDSSDTQRLHQAFTEWRSIVRARRVLLVGMEDVVQDRSVHRQRKEMRVCFDRWRKHATLKKRIRMMVARWKKRQFVSAFHGWSLYVSTKNARRWQEAAASQYYQRRCLAMAFFSWRMEVRATQWASDFGASARGLDNVVVHVSVSLARLTEGIRLLSPLTSLSSGAVVEQSDHADHDDDIETRERKRWLQDREAAEHRRLSAAQSIGNLPHRAPRTFVGFQEEARVDEMMYLMRPGAAVISESPVNRGLTQSDEHELKETMFAHDQALATLRGNMTPVRSRPPRSVIRQHVGEAGDSPGIRVFPPHIE